MKKILVVDDDNKQRELYVELFGNHGFQVESANDGLEGLEKALANPPDLVFTGIIMPRMDGFEFIHNLRNNAVTVITPVIMFSHLGRQEDREKAKKLNDVHFMLKGYDDPNKILAKVKELLGLGPKANTNHHQDDERQGTGTI